VGGFPRLGMGGHHRSEIHLTETSVMYYLLDMSIDLAHGSRKKVRWQLLTK